MLAAVVTLAVPGRTSANVSIAADGARVAVVWAASLDKGGTDIYIATSRDGGRTFRTPLRVNDTPGEARVGGEQPPRVLVRRSTVLVSWVSNRDGTTIRLARSTDDGVTFGASRSVSHVGAPGSRGWQSMAFDRHGDVEVAWLDHRALVDSHTEHDMQKAAAPDHDESEPDAAGAIRMAATDGAAMTQRSALYVARVTAAGIQPEQRVTTGVCYCCKTALTGSRGGVAAAWRHVYPGNMRDIAFTHSVSDSAFAPPVRVSSDRWSLAGCPDDGPAIAADATSHLHIVWPTVVKTGEESSISLFYATTTDGATFTPREKLPTRGVAHHPEVTVAADGTLLLTWDESLDHMRHVAMARGKADHAGRIQFMRESAGDADEGVYPIAAATSAGFVVAWTAYPGSGSVIRVEQLPAR